MPRLLAVVLTLAASAATLLLPATGANAAPAATLSPSTVVPGSSFTISGSGCFDPDYSPFIHPKPQWIAAVGGAFGTGSVVTSDSPGGAWSITMHVAPGQAPGSGSVESFCRLSNEKMFSYPKLWLTVMPLVMPPSPPAPAPAPVPAPRATVAPRSTDPAPAPAPSAAPAATSTVAVVPPTATPTGTPTANCADCTVLATGRELTAGHDLHLGYAGFQPGELVTVVLHSTPRTLGTFTADATGSVRTTLTLPEDAEVGAHTLTFTGAASGDLVVVPFRLAAPELAGVFAAGRASASRSDDSREAAVWLSAGGAVVVLLGLGGFVAGRRRRARAESDQAAATPIAAPIT